MSKVAKLGARGTVSIECNGPSAASQSPAPTHAGDGLCGTVPVVPDLHDIVCRGLPNARPARLRHLHRLPGRPALDGELPDVPGQALPSIAPPPHKIFNDTNDDIQ